MLPAPVATTWDLAVALTVALTVAFGKLSTSEKCASEKCASEKFAWNGPFVKAMAGMGREEEGGGKGKKEESAGKKSVPQLAKWSYVHLLGLSFCRRGELCNC